MIYLFLEAHAMFHLGQMSGKEYPFSSRSTPTISLCHETYVSILTLLPRNRVKFHRLRAQSHETAPTSGVTFQVAGRQVTHDSCLTWLQISGSHNTLLKFSQAQLICYNDSQKWGKHIFPYSKEYDKGYR